MKSIVKQRKIWFTLSSILVIGSLMAVLALGLKLGIDFQGGSLLEIQFNQQTIPPSSEIVIQSLSALDLGTVTAQLAGESDMIIRFREVDEDTHQQILTTLSQNLAIEGLEGNIIEEKRFESIGAVIGKELKNRTILAVSIVLVIIVIYIAWAFRKVADPIASWKYGIIATLALFHDVIITLGAFAILGYFYGIEINAPFVAAILTILGFSVNDTIIVFDRTRENLIKNLGSNFEDVVQKSLDEVIVRSINTSFTVLLTLFAILVLGGPSVRDFILALIIGFTVGAYSSIFVASPLLVTWEKLGRKK